MRLNSEAREQLRTAGISHADWARRNYFQDGRWHGDACGCPDDRCIGFHHDARDDCGCLFALLTDAAGATTAPAIEDVAFCIDADCPACGWPERWHAPNIGLFGCPNCAHTSTERDS